MELDLATIAPPKEQEKQHEDQENLTLLIPRYHVVLLDDDYHTVEYVIEMLVKLFGHSRPKAFEMAVRVHLGGRAIVDTTTKDRAALKRDQIHAFGPDPLVPYCQGSMSAIIEPAK